MTKIRIERGNIERRINDLLEVTDELDAALGSMPGTADGGVASQMIAMITASAASAAGHAADAYRSLGAITLDVMENASLEETQIKQVFTDMEKEMDQR